MTHFAKNLRHYADSLGISHAKVAERAGLTPRAFSHYVTGIREPNMAALLRISKTVGVTPNELLDDGEPEDLHQQERMRTLLRIQAACERLDDPTHLELIEAAVQAMTDHLAEKV